jgi:hypothetical protein
MATLLREAARLTTSAGHGGGYVTLITTATLTLSLSLAKRREIDLRTLAILALASVIVVNAVNDVNVVNADAWYELRDCESGNDYAIDTGNGYYGAYQFSLETWQGVGGSGYPNLATPEEQDYRAWLLFKTSGPHHWPICGRELTHVER